ncbi:hypothetical protein ABPG75_011331 [Micractinium tetrahymenae]
MLWENVRTALLRRGAEPAVLFPPEALSAAQLLQMVQAAAQLVLGAARHPPKPPSDACEENFLPICAIFLTNSAAYVVAVLAALRLGMAFMPLDPGWPPHRLQAVCEEARPALVIWAHEGAAGGHGKPAVAGVPLLQLPDLPDLVQQAEATQQPAGQAGAAASALRAPPAPALPGGSGGCSDSGGAAAAAGCCYVLYTSGSTGRPLGVRGTQAGVVNRCRWLESVLPFQPGDRVAFKTATCFVDSVWEVFGPLLAGVPLVAVPQAMMRRPAELLRLLASQQATHVAAVPTHWRALASAMQQQPGVAAQLRLRLAVSSGEPLTAGLLGLLQCLLPAGCAIWNLYGSTEVAADCTAFDWTCWQPAEQPRELQAQAAGPVQPQGRQQHEAAGPAQSQEQWQPQPGQLHSGWVPAGCPISGAFVAVLGPEPQGGPSAPEAAPGEPESSRGPVSRRQAVPAGALGEVAVGGTVVAAGYLGRHPATLAAQRSRFVQLPASQLAGLTAEGGQAAQLAVGDPCRQHQQSEQAGKEEQLVRLFITGDLGWLDSSGCLHLAGRRDLQAKISGVRVDLAEVAAALEEHPAVAAAAARVWQLAAGPVLEAYVELAAEEDAGNAELKGWCQQRLPPAAVPQLVHVLETLPRSAGGKVQRSELPPSAEVAAALAAAQGRDAALAAGAAAEAPTAITAADAAGAAAGAASAPAEERRLVKWARYAASSPAAEAQPAAAAAAPQPRPVPPPYRPVSEVEVSAAFALALGHSDFEATTNLFSIGGTSLTAAEVAGQVAGGRIEAVLQHPTVRSLAAHLNALSRRQAAKEERHLAAVAAHAAGGEAEGGETEGPGQQHVQPTAAEPAAALARARPLDLHAGGSPKESDHASGSLRLAWRARLLQCVDAAPLMAAEPQQAQPHQVQQQRAAAGRIFACSHGGDVCCFDSSSGQRLWQTVLPDRTDAGLALCHGPSCCSDGPQEQLPQQQRMYSQQLDSQQEQRSQGQLFVAVATNGGSLIFLDATSGAVKGSIEAGGGLRAAPACDPWAGLVWQPTHGRQLLVAAAPGQEVGRLPLPAAVSAAVSFCAAEHLAFVCCLDGTLLALQAEEEGRHPEQQHEHTGRRHEQQQGQQGRQEHQWKLAGAWQLRVAWEWRAAAPLFTPAVVAGSSVLAAAVDGSVAALSCHDGSLLWRTSVQGAIFAPPLLLAPPTAAVLLVGTQEGQLVALKVSTGWQLAAARAGDRVTGLRQLLPSHKAGPAVVEAGSDGPRERQQQQQQPQQQGEQHSLQQLLVVTLACGVVALVDAAALPHTGSHASGGACNAGSSGSSMGAGSSGSSDWLVDAVRLPGDVFAVPAAGRAFDSGTRVAVGCRDDHLYCMAVCE